MVIIENKIKNPIRIYPLDLIKQAIIAPAFQNKTRAANTGVFTEFTDEHKVAEAVLTNSKFDFSNYFPEDSSLPIIVMENSKLKVHDLARQAIMGKIDPTDIFNGEIDG